MTHLPGKQNCTADFLSREVDATHTAEQTFACYAVDNVAPVPFPEGIKSKDPSQLLTVNNVVESQKGDDRLRVIREQLLSNTPATLDKEYLKQYTLYQDIFFHRSRPDSYCGKIVIPEQLIVPTIREMHERLGHFGAKRIYRALKELCTLEGMHRHVSRITTACDICQRTKHDHFLIRGKMLPIIPDKPLDLLSTDM
ncbi:uncharacterized protein LOC120349907 [Nilaparvata lugens]|uniref:uncharacterized protein LOC120349907 n=1 Tax=Nilaparvata lugens TaxID=108931 RepID=UPI00193DAD59|nr:uncharacterized protein LOC120349907 [Nilaparvata lugens]